MQSVQSHSFAQVPAHNVQRSSFNRGRSYKTTLNAGYLVPFYRVEVLPGDTFITNCNIFTRMSSSLNVAPMDNMYMDFFYFFVSNRLVWEHWKQFMGEKKNPGDTTTYILPTITAPAVTGFTSQSVSDYLGLPVGIPGIEVNALYHRGINLIWHEWFRDENLQNSPTLNYDDGPDAVADYPLLKRGKRHDYFTSCLPWPQKGTAVPLPLGSSAPVISTGTAVKFGVIGTGAGPGSNKPLNISSSTQSMYFTDGADYAVKFTDSALIADLTNATAATVNAIRTAFQGQMYLELDARGGTRYTELIRSHFGVISPDSRLQRPEFLGGGSFPININQVPQTSQSDTTPQGTIAAYALAGGSAGGFRFSATEHGMIIGLASVRADITYQQGIHRDFLRSTKYDYYDPIFAHLGEQAVTNAEIWATGTSADDTVFGYQERHAEYRYGKSEITGMLRSDVSGSLDVYHLSQDFASCPELNDAFISENPPIDRITAITTAPQFIVDVQINETAVRPMPVYSIPGLIDHM